MITFSRLGRKGRLGNQLFHVAGMIGLAHRSGQELCLPAWKYARYFECGKQWWNWKGRGSQTLEEKDFHYVPEYWDRLSTGDWDVNAWLQTEKLWESCKNEVCAALAWEPGFKQQVLSSARALPGLDNAIAISVRRGDYVGNPNYVLLPVSYYMQALMQYFPDWMERPILIFSDDMAYCRQHFEGLPNVWFCDGMDDISQLLVMSMCQGFVIANSTFSWWGAYLAELRDPGVRIVRPAHLFAGKLLDTSDSRDHWPERWLVYDHKGEDGKPKRYDLSDVTFTMPVYFDHDDRRQNLDLNLCLLQRVFDSNYIVTEIGIESENLPPRFEYMQEWAQYRYQLLPHMHRTRVLNDMAVEAKTAIIANWDVDVAVPEVQVVVAVEWLRRYNADMVYPYDGRFARVPRQDWFKRLEKELDLGIFKFERFKGSFPSSNSVGGVVFWNRLSFLGIGGENEGFISHGPEDAERYDRAKFLGLDVRRVVGQLFHMDHWVGPQSNGKHGYRNENHEALKQTRDKIAAGDVVGLEAMIENWSWYEQKLKPALEKGVEQL